MPENQLTTLSIQHPENIHTPPMEGFLVLTLSPPWKFQFSLILSLNSKIRVFEIHLCHHPKKFLIIFLRVGIMGILSWTAHWRLELTFSYGLLILYDLLKTSHQQSTSFKKREYGCIQSVIFMFALLKKKTH